MIFGVMLRRGATCAKGSISLLRGAAAGASSRGETAALRYRSMMQSIEFERRFHATARSTNKLVFIEPDGEEIEVEFESGDTILDVALDNDIEIEGACGGECACSTCHVILDSEDFSTFPDPDEEEEDMLDLALGLTDTSRLGCQIVLEPQHSGMRIQLPEESESMLS